MITVGEILSRARIAKRLTFEQVEKATKIRAKFLTALERNEFVKLPPGTFTKGLIKNYAAYLGLSVEETMAFYRRQVDEERARVVPEPRSREALKRFRLTPQIFTIASISFLLACFFGYLIFSYFKFAGNPTLVVNQPKNNVVVSADKIEVAGRLDPDASLVVNNEFVPTSEDGDFKVDVPLEPGLNTLTITATNKFKRQTTITRNVRLEQ